MTIFEKNVGPFQVFYCGYALEELAITSDSGE